MRFDRHQRRRYCFLLNADGFPCPFLLEMSRRTQLGYTSVSYYDPDVLYCSYEMNEVIDQLQDNSEFFRNYRDDIHPILCNILMDYFEWDADEIHDSVVHIVMEVYIFTAFAKTNRRLTRHAFDVIHDVLRNGKRIRESRLTNESHLTNTLVFDCQRSIRELRHAMVLQNVIRF